MDYWPCNSLLLSLPLHTARSVLLALPPPPLPFLLFIYLLKNILILPVLFGVDMGEGEWSDIPENESEREERPGGGVGEEAPSRLHSNSSHMQIYAQGFNHGVLSFSPIIYLSAILVPSFILFSIFFSYSTFCHLLLIVLFYPCHPLFFFLTFIFFILSLVPSCGCLLLSIPCNED